MHCPFCRSSDTRVLDPRVADDGSAIRRRRTCPSCEKRFTTVEQMQLMVLKRSGSTEPFNRDKAIAGVRKSGKSEIINLTPAQKAAWKKALIKVHTDRESAIGKDLIQAIYKETGFDPAKL